jgi:DegV family protein with EDD domain
VSLTRRNIPRTCFLAVFDTLEYLRRGGRIGAAQAFLGSMLKVNPIITLKDGVVEPAGRARSRAKAIDYLYDFALGYPRIEEIAVEDGDCPGDAGMLVERLKSHFPGQHIYRSRMTPVIGTHTGPGLLAVAIIGDRG